VTRAAIATSILFLLSSSCFCEVIDPPPLKVRQVCGIAIAANAQLILKPDDSRQTERSVRSDKDGKFDFGSVPAGVYRLSMKWPDQGGNFSGPIHNSYPIRVVSTQTFTGCRRPLEVGVLRGSESGLAVSFRVRANK
jgi:hypothetical protein